MDLSLQDSGPFLCEGDASEPTEPPLATSLQILSYIRHCICLRDCNAGYMPVT